MVMIGSAELLYKLIPEEIIQKGQPVGALSLLGFLIFSLSLPTDRIL